MRKVDSWHTSFGVQPGDWLHVPPADRARAWRSISGLRELGAEAEYGEDLLRRSALDGGDVTQHDGPGLGDGGLLAP